LEWTRSQQDLAKALSAEGVKACSLTIATIMTTVMGLTITSVVHKAGSRANSRAMATECKQAIALAKKNLQPWNQSPLPQHLPRLPQEPLSQRQEPLGQHQEPLTRLLQVTLGLRQDQKLPGQLASYSLNSRSILKAIIDHADTFHY
jgi:hypothetical protein